MTNYHNGSIALTDSDLYCIRHWIADAWGCSPSWNSISKAVYKGTNCGAWIEANGNGVRVGTIVEGSDAEYAEDIDLDGVSIHGEGASLFMDRLHTALGNCEAFVDDVNADRSDELYELSEFDDIDFF